MSINTESDERLYVKVRRIDVLAPIVFERQASFRMSKAEIKRHKEYKPDYDYEYAGLVEAPGKDEYEETQRVQ